MGVKLTFMAVRLLIKIDDMCSMSQPVEERRGQSRLSEELGPICRLEIFRNDYRTPLVTFRQDLEQKLDALLRERNIAEFIQ
jgi:hypothetical protein